VLALRLAYWNRRRAAPSEQVLAAAGDTAAFVSGFLAAVLLHYVQNVLYFSSATMAYADLFGSLGSRTSLAPNATTRLGGVFVLAQQYLGRFFAPDDRWSQPVPLAAAGALLVAAAVHGVVGRLRAPDRPGGATRRWDALVAVLVVAGALATMLLWFYAVPFHASPHRHLFPRLLLIPFIVATAGLVVVLSPARCGGAPDRRRSVTCLAILAVLVAVVGLGPGWSAAAIDAYCYDHSWIGTHGAPDVASMAAPLLPATPDASSIDPRVDLGGPLQVKDILMVGHINIWGSDLEANPSLRWVPPDPGPSWYEQRFAALARVTDVTIRLWGLPHLRGAATPASFVLSGVASDGTIHPLRRYPDRDDPPVLQGKYIVFHYRFDPPVASTALRLDFHRTVGGGPPALFDFQAFGTIDGGAPSVALSRNR
jgi:hypothetical protein